MEASISTNVQGYYLPEAENLLRFYLFNKKLSNKK